MTHPNTRVRIVNEILGRQEKKYSEQEQANHLMHLLMENYPLLSASVIAVEPGGKGISLFAQRGLSNNFIKEMYARKEHPLITAAMKSEVAVSGGDSGGKDPGFRWEHACKALYAAPCRLQEETLGVFIADSMDPGLLNEETRQDLLAYSRLATLFLALRNLQGRISRVPDVDAVTGLFTFKYFHEVLHRELSRARKFGHAVSLMIMKIRGLREMNEVYGHVPADNALAALGAAIRAALRDVDYAARSGGSFYVLLPEMTKAEAGEAAAKIAASLDASPIGQGNVFLKLAIGIASFPKDAKEEKVLLPLVESMVHESMRKGGNAVSVYKD
ncbi:MAG TPA: GGDEF domain-containing protein [Candidatus Deferrimicrobiaceae bacterium]|jgi:diguanylate cyclase (GGDEF)-like protein